MNTNKDALQRKVDELQKQAEEIEELGIKLLEEAPFEKNDAGEGYFDTLDYRSQLRKVQHEVILKYQQWYSTSLRLVDEYIPEMTETFKKHYYDEDFEEQFFVMNYLKLDLPDIDSRNYAITSFLNDFETQLSILLSIPPVVEVKEFGLRQLITADVARTEIEQAEILLESGYERAAGSIAGVALELHLKTQCDINGISYPLKPTIEPLAQVLYKEKKLDITEMKQIQYLASVRNKCSHPEDVSAKEVRNLIDGVKKLI